MLTSSTELIALVALIAKAAQAGLLNLTHMHNEGTGPGDAVTGLASPQARAKLRVPISTLPGPKLCAR